jgi:hypothetical protein
MLCFSSGPVVFFSSKETKQRTHISSQCLHVHPITFSVIILGKITLLLTYFFYRWAAPSTVDVKPPVQRVIGSLVEFKTTGAWKYSYLLTPNPKDMKKYVELNVHSAIHFYCLAHILTAKFNCLFSLDVLHFNDRTYQVASARCAVCTVSIRLNTGTQTWHFSDRASWINFI